MSTYKALLLKILRKRRWQFGVAMLISFPALLAPIGQAIRYQDDSPILFWIMVVSSITLTFCIAFLADRFYDLNCPKCRVYLCGPMKLLKMESCANCGLQLDSLVESDVLSSDQNNK